jgi:exportin-1
MNEFQAPLWNTKEITDPTMTNQRFLRDYVCKLLIKSFPNLLPSQVQHFVLGLFELKELSSFKNHLRDFLCQIKVCRFFLSLQKIKN